MSNLVCIVGARSKTTGCEQPLFSELALTLSNSEWCLNVIILRDFHPKERPEWGNVTGREGGCYD